MVPLLWLNRLYPFVLMVATSSTFSVVSSGRLDFSTGLHFWLNVTLFVLYDWWVTESSYTQAESETVLMHVLYILYLVLLVSLPIAVMAASFTYISFNTIAAIWMALAAADFFYFHLELRRIGQTYRSHVNNLSYAVSTLVSFVASFVTLIFAHNPNQVAWGLTIALLVDFVFSRYVVAQAWRRNR